MNYLILALIVLLGQPAPPEPPAPSPSPYVVEDGYTVRPISTGTATIKLSGADRIWLKGDGSRRVGKGGVSSGPNGIQLEGCTRIRVSNITLTNWFQGIRANNSSDLEFLQVVCTKNTRQGFLLNNCKRVLLRQCEGSKTSGNKYSQHGFYAGNYGGGNTDSVTVEDSSFFGSVLAEFQINAESASKKATNITLDRVSVTNDVFATNFLSADVKLVDTKITSKKKAISAARSYGRSWPTYVTKTGETRIIGNVVTSGGSTVK
jgi:hypothetical protein